MEKFAERLKKLIEEKKLPLNKIAIESKVSAGQYKKYLNGSLPRLKIALRIVNYFHCSLNYLLGISGNKNTNCKK